MTIHITLIDQEDSFVFNLADELAKQNCDVDVFRSTVTLSQAISRIHDTQAQALVFSPGPGSPKDARLCHALLDKIPANLPVLGVCLGHQCIVEHFGGHVGRSPKPVHGKSAMIHHDQQGLFKNLSPQIAVGRYHSLCALELPKVLRATAFCDDLVMAVQHQTRPIFGVQFHPESVLTQDGSQIIKNFLDKVH